MKASIVRCVLAAAVLAIPAMARAVPSVTVMTYNVYVGGDLDPVTAAILQPNPDPQAIALAAGALFSAVEATNFSARASGIADQIGATQPHIIGLQEVALWRTGLPQSPEPATAIAFDFLAILQSELAARNLNYSVAVQRTVFDAELTAVTPVPGDPPLARDVRLTDQDVILVRNDVAVLNSMTATFAANLGPPLFPIPVTRGWLSVDAQVDGFPFRFLSTHLEPTVAPVNVGQGTELLALAASAGLPLIFTGDFNSTAPSGATYGLMTGAGGFTDAWLAAGSGAGFTCCQDAALLAPSDLEERIDFVFFRDGLTAVGADVIGESDADRVAGLLLSDHAGVVATLLFVPEPGTLLLLLVGLAGVRRFARR